MIKVVNTHIKWDAEDKPAEGHVGYRQIKELIENHVKADEFAQAWILCGDFNAQPNSSIVKQILSNGFEDSYRGHEQSTCNSNRKPKRIDYIFRTKNLRAEPAKLPKIDDLTPLPSETEPSDHIAIYAYLSFH